MRKRALASAISLASVAICQQAFANSMTCSVGGGTNNGLVYTTTATSNGIAAGAAATVDVYYVDNALSTASNRTSAAITLVVGGDWCIDTSNGAFSGAFEGNIAYGDYKTQTNVAFPPADGRQTYVGANQHFAGNGTWGTNGSGLPTLSFSYFNTTLNGGGASTYSATSTSCVDGVTSSLGKVCVNFYHATMDWEGLAFLFTFDATRYSFTGTLAGKDTSALSFPGRHTSTINWNIAGVDPPAVPIPAAGWLFGSALLGVAASRRE